MDYAIPITRRKRRRRRWPTRLEWLAIFAVVLNSSCPVALINTWYHVMGEVILMIWTIFLTVGWFTVAWLILVPVVWPIARRAIKDLIWGVDE